MKIDARDAAASSSAEKQKEPFRKTLGHARPKVPARRVPLPARGHLTSASGPGHLSAHMGAAMVHAQERLQGELRLHQTLASARTTSERACSQRSADRSAGLSGMERKVKDRIAELLARDLGRLPDPAKKDAPPGMEDRVRATTPPPMQVSERPAQLTASGSGETGGAAKVSSVMALVEKVEVFVRSQRPTLSLSLGGELSGQVEIEKVGPGKIALRWTGRSRQDPDAAQRIRRALADRGLEVTRLVLG